MSDIDHAAYAAKILAMLGEVEAPGEWSFDPGYGHQHDGDGFAIDYGLNRRPTVVVLPSGAPDDGGDLLATAAYENRGDLALMAEAKRLAAAYLDAAEQLAKARTEADRG